MYMILYFIVFLHLNDSVEEVDVLDSNIQQLSPAHLLPVSAIR